MKYTNKQISKIEDSAKKRSRDLVHITNKSGFSTEDKIKLGLCKHFVQFIVIKRIKSKELAEMLGIPNTRVSEITNYKFQKFTVDILLTYLEKLAEHDGQIREYLKLFRSIAEMPVPSVSTTRSILRKVEASVHAGA